MIRMLLNIHTDMHPEKPLGKYMQTDVCYRAHMCIHTCKYIYIKTPYASQQKEEWSPVRDHSEALSQHCPPSSEPPFSPRFLSFFTSASFHHPLPPVQVQPAPFLHQST